MRYLLLLLVLVTGCTTTINEIPNQPCDSVLSNFKSVDDVIKLHLTPAAYAAVRGIPVVRGRTFAPFVSGVNFWSNLGSFVLFNGIGRKIIVDSDDLRGGRGLKTIIHEYIHHIDDMDRDGLHDLIDHREFIVAFFRMKNDPEYSGDAKSISRRADAFITNVFGIGPYSEEIAYTAGRLVMNGGPPYMWYVFRKILIPPKSPT